MTKESMLHASRDPRSEDERHRRVGDETIRIGPKTAIALPVGMIIGLLLLTWQLSAAKATIDFALTAASERDAAAVRRDEELLQQIEDLRDELSTKVELLRAETTTDLNDRWRRRDARRMYQMLQRNFPDMTFPDFDTEF